MTIRKEAVKAAIAAHNAARLDDLGSKAAMEAALTAALPHLAPQPSQTDEERAKAVVKAIECIMDDDPNPWDVMKVAKALAAARAEAALAERERGDRLEAALLPFANAVDDKGNLKSGTMAISYRNDFLAARAAIRGRRP